MTFRWPSNPYAQEIKAYFGAHQSEYQTPEQARSRTSNQVDAGAGRQGRCCAKAKAEALLKQIQGGANFAELAKQTPTTQAARTMARVALCPARHMVPESTRPSSPRRSATADCKSQFGYHIVQVEERKPRTRRTSAKCCHHSSHAVPPEGSCRRESFAHALTLRGHQNGLEKTAAAHH